MINDNLTTVSAEKYAEMWDKVETQNIGENQKTRFSVFHLGREYVLTWSASSLADGRICVGGYAVEDVATYRGDLMPMESELHNEAIDAGKRERAYTGMIIRFGKRTLVFCEKITFKSNNIKELKLF